jgi:hypothetical protein
MIDKEALQTGLRQLDDLSWKEYGESLSEVAAEADEQKTLDRVGRLIGVTMKQPLAEPQTLDTPTLTTRAYRQWELKDEKTIHDCEQNTWQYQTLAALSQDEQVIESLGYQPPSV